MPADLSRLRALSADPMLVPQVYDYCDQWCEYCPLTERCLAFRWVDLRGGGSVSDIHTDLAAIHGSGNGRGLSTVDAIAALGAHLGDPLEALGREYAARAHMFLRSLTPEAPAPSAAGNGSPGSRAILAHYHLLIAGNIFRAIAAAADPAEAADRSSAANGSAKVVLLMADRSREALADLARTTREGRVADLSNLLERIEGEVVRRFPLARAFERPGFDGPRLTATDQGQVPRLSMASTCPDTA